MNKLITILVILANICGGALLLFDLFGLKMDDPEARITQATAFFMAGAASLILVAGAANDIFQSGRRPVGIAILLTAIWVAAVPVLHIEPLRGKLDAFFLELSKQPILILGLFLIILARQAIHGAKQPLGYGLVMLVPVILCLQARFLGGLAGIENVDDVHYFGLISIMAAFTVMLVLGPGYQSLASWGLCILLLMGGAYHVLT